MWLVGHVTEISEILCPEKKSSEISEISYFSKSLGISFVSNNNFRLEIG